MAHDRADNEKQLDIIKKELDKLRDRLIVGGIGTACYAIALSVELGGLINAMSIADRVPLRGLLDMLLANVEESALSSRDVALRHGLVHDGIDAVSCAMLVDAIVENAVKKK